MPRETETYRDCLERLDELAPGKEILSMTEVAKMMGINRHTAAKRFAVSGGYISKVNLARSLAKMGGARG